MFRHMVALLFLAAVASSQNERNTRQLFRDGLRGGPSKPETMFGRYGRSSASEESTRDEPFGLDPKAISGLNKAQQRSGGAGLGESYGVPLGAPIFGHDVVNNVIASKSSGPGLGGRLSSGLDLGAGFSKFGSCGNGLERTIYGKCVAPLVSQDLYIYKAPSYKVPYEPVNYEHKPKVHLNFVFIKSPSVEGELPHPVVVPPPKQKTHVYLLSKKPHERHQQVIEVPHKNERPEVFFVGYKDGDNPVLPGGIDLKTALSQAAQPGDGHAIGYGGGSLIDAGDGLGSGLGLGVSSSGLGAHGGSFAGHDDGSSSLGFDDGNFALGHGDGSLSQGHGGSIGVAVGSKGGFSGGVLGGGGFSGGVFSGGHDDGSFSHGGSVSLGHGGGSFSHGQGGSVSLGHGGGSFSGGKGGSVSLGHGGGSFSGGKGGSFSGGKGGSISLIGHDGGSFSQGLGVDIGGHGGFSGGVVGGGHGGGFLDYGEAFDLSGGDKGLTVDDLIFDLGDGKGGFKNPGFRDGLEAALANDDIDEIVIDHGVQDVKPKLVTEVVGSLHGGGKGSGSLHGPGGHGGHGGHGTSGSFGGIGLSGHDVSSSSGFGQKRSSGGGFGATAHVEGVGVFTGGKRFSRGGFSGSFEDSLEVFKKRGGSVLKANKVVLKGV